MCVYNDRNSVNPARKTGKLHTLGKVEWGTQNRNASVEGND